MGTVQAPLSGSGGPTAADVDAHTIVRAPVLYKKSPANSEGNETQTTGNNNGKNNDASKANKETSPPDRIVASYAAAAHAAALANHQPVSKAAEVFLAATTNSTGRSRHPKRSRPHGSSNTALAHSELSAKRLATSAVSASTPDSGGSAASLTSLNSNGWRRIVDRMSRKVVYIAPDGISLNNTSEVCAYFRTRYPNITDAKNYEELITSTFIFEPTTEAPSLDNGPNFLTSAQPQVSNSSSNSSIVSTSNGLSLLSDNGTKSNSSTCRIAFNPSFVRSNGSNLLARKSTSESITETVAPAPNRSSQPDDSDTSKGSSFNREMPLSSPSNSTAPETVSASPKSAQNGSESATDLDPKFDPKNGSTEPSENTEISVSESSVSNALIPKTNSLLTEDNSSSAVKPGDQNNITVSSNSETPIFQADLSVQLAGSSHLNSSTSEDTGVTRMSTETLTTGILNTTIPSCGSTVIPSVMPSVGSNDISLLALAGLVSEPSLLYSCGNGEMATAGMSVNPLLTNSRLAQAQAQQQQQQQQQQLSALISALSAGSANPQPTLQTPASLFGNNAQFNPLILAANPQYGVTWSAVGSTPVSWSDLNGSSVMSTLSALQQHQQQHQQQQQQQQQQLAAAAALQQQQIRAAYAAQAAVLLQRQQILATQQQHQQQLAMAAAGQVQAYLAALQRNLSIG
ncbi:unnamed protein product [Echinostoma caproni]|uniref:MBD domain-containing protein n=1 Tax=Echinostoma caproni TaxID=27848 RepID=A0A183AEW7_9TREM|nr:unnamed protein product [Echinostoma caproni]